jgi:H+/gluconate symporter-like permease
MLLVVSLAASATTQEPGVAPTQPAGHPGSFDPSWQNTRNLNTVTLVGSMIASVTSLIGFITTTIITWRKEKREASLADVQRKKLETELEKSKLELEELKNSTEKKKSKK